MSKLAIHDVKGASVGELDIPDDLLVRTKGSQAVHDVVVATLAGRRAGTASTLTKGEVAGTGAKPWRQKGTGRARAGYRQSPVWRGGAVAFGPRPRDYSKKVNRKVARLAFKRAMSDKFADGAVKVVDEISLSEAKTKAFMAILASLDISAPALVVVESVDDVLALASRNVPRIEVVAAKDVNVYQLVRYPAILATAKAVEELKQRLGTEAEVSK